VPVFVYTNGDEAELFLNGKSLGRRSKDREARWTSKDDGYYKIVDRYRLRWNDVIFEPGDLKAVAYQDGVKIGEATRRTAGPAAALRLTPDRTTIAADGVDLSYVLVEMIDASGTVCPLADDRVTFTIRGPGSLAGVGNGNPASLESFVGSEHNLFHGKAMLIVRSKRGIGGEIIVTAIANGVQAATTRIASQD
jgi:beta-galactosidase